MTVGSEDSNEIIINLDEIEDYTVVADFSGTLDSLVGITENTMKSKTKETLCITFQTYWPFVEISRKEQIDLSRQPKLRIGCATRTMSKRLRTFG